MGARVSRLCQGGLRLAAGLNCGSSRDLILARGATASWDEVRVGRHGLSTSVIGVTAPPDLTEQDRMGAGRKGLMHADPRQGPRRKRRATPTSWFGPTVSAIVFVSLLLGALSWVEQIDAERTSGMDPGPSVAEAQQTAPEAIRPSNHADESLLPAMGAQASPGRARLRGALDQSKTPCSDQAGEVASGGGDGAALRTAGCDRDRR